MYIQHSRHQKYFKFICFFCICQCHKKHLLRYGFQNSLYSLLYGERSLFERLLTYSVILWKMRKEIQRDSLGMLRILGNLVVWCGIMKGRIVVPYFFKGALTGARYLDFLQIDFVPALIQIHKNPICFSLIFFPT